MIAYVRLISISKILHGRDEGRYLYKFWQEDGKILVDELLLVLDEEDPYYRVDNTYMLNLSLILV